MKNSKNKLVMGAVSVAMCGALLTGGTLAYFTKTVTSTGNTIATKHFDVDVKQEEGKFDGKIQAGKPVTKKVTVYNNGELDFGYSLNIVEGDNTGIDNISTELQQKVNVKVDNKDVGTLHDVLTGSKDELVGKLTGGTLTSLPASAAVHEVTLTLSNEPLDADTYSGKSVGNFDIEVVANEVVSE